MSVNQHDLQTLFLAYKNIYTPFLSKSAKKVTIKV